MSPADLRAGSVVFEAPPRPVPLDSNARWWSYVAQASWRRPLGPRGASKTRPNLPVVQVAYEDAEAYARWAGKRLPTEAEFEFAARGGLAGRRYAWGDNLRPGGRWMANTFQGHFPDRDSGEDGRVGIAPVASFPPNGYGLHDMAGNVWEWCSDWYRADTYAKHRGRRARRRGTRRDRRAATIPPSPAYPSACIAAARSFARASSVRATWLARAGRAKSRPARTTSASGACSRRPDADRAARSIAAPRSRRLCGVSRRCRRVAASPGRSHISGHANENDQVGNCDCSHDGRGRPGNAAARGGTTSRGRARIAGRDHVDPRAAAAAAAAEVRRQDREERRAVEAVLARARRAAEGRAERPPHHDRRHRLRRHRARSGA